MRIFFLSLSFFMLISCSLRKLVVDLSSPLIREVEHAFLSEKDIEFARQALPAHIKLAEGIHDYYPRSSYYSGKLCFLYAAYTFSFIDETPYDDFEEDREKKIRRVLEYYQRAFDYGMTSMDRRIKGFAKTIQKEPDTVLRRVRKKDVETLFWLNFSWAMLIFNDTSNPRRLLELETVKKIADAIVRLDSAFLDGAVYAIYVAYYGGRSETIGGNWSLCERYYLEGKRVSKGQSLILDFVYFKFVAPQLKDDALFRRLYADILDRDIDRNPAFQLINQVIRIKAMQLFKKKDDFF